MRADHSPAEWRKKLGRRAARLVREIKEKIAKETENMTFVQFKEYLNRNQITPITK